MRVLWFALRALIGAVILAPCAVLAELNPPSFVTASANARTHIRVEWGAVQGASQYQVFRRRGDFEWGPTPCDSFSPVRITPPGSGELLFDQYAENLPAEYQGEVDFAVRAVDAHGTPGSCSQWVGGRFLPPVFAQQPSAQRVFLGQEATFQALGDGPRLRYVWQRVAVSQGSGPSAPWNAIPAAPDSSVYTFSPTLQDAQYYYRVMVLNFAGRSYSQPVTLTVDGPPHVVFNPTSTYAFAGQLTGFTVVASGYQLQYQWQMYVGGGWWNFTVGDNPSGITPALRFVAAPDLDGREYRVVVSNGAGTYASPPVTLTVYGPPEFSEVPQSQSAFVGQTVLFQCRANGASVQYAWFINGEQVVGGDGSTLSVMAQPALDQAAIRCDAFNTAGTVVSPTVRLSVLGAPQLTTHPADAAVLVGQPAQFHAQAEGVGLTLQWQWRHQSNGLLWTNFGSSMPSGSTDTLSYASTWIGLDQTQFRMCASNPSGSACSSAATLSVRPNDQGGGGDSGGGDDPDGGGGTDGGAGSGGGDTGGSGDTDGGGGAPPGGGDNGDGSSGGEGQDCSSEMQVQGACPPAGVECQLFDLTALHSTLNEEPLLLRDETLKALSKLGRVARRNNKDLAKRLHKAAGKTGAKLEALVLEVVASIAEVPTLQLHCAPHPSCQLVDNREVLAQYQSRLTEMATRALRAVKGAARKVYSERMKVKKAIRARTKPILVARDRILEAARAVPPQRSICPGGG
ncbi:MAG: immunoglobulin domain-containing protein [Bdellovibrionota bacterium]|nr:MAG: immunoglobulin domain-containing protein [Bdellovibrionota bacterium]